jgi:hypothetical protein
MLNNFSDTAIALLLFEVWLAFPPQTSFARHWQERRNRHRGDRGSCDSRARVRCWRARGLGWPLYDAMFLAAVLSIGSTAIHSGVVSGSFEFGEILMTIGRIGLFLSEEPFCLRRPCHAPIILAHRQARALRDNYHFFALGTAFGLAFLSSHQLSFSAATGACLASVVIAGNKFSEMIST